MSGRLLPQHPLSYPEIDTPRIAPKVRRASTNLPVVRNFARSKSLEISGADWKHWVMQNGHSDFNRRRFVQLAAASTLAVGAHTSGSAAASLSETEPLVTPQPAPRFTPDENTSDIIVETLIAWGATHAFSIVGDGINPIIEPSGTSRQDSLCRRPA